MKKLQLFLRNEETDFLITSRLIQIENQPVEYLIEIDRDTIIIKDSSKYNFGLGEK